MMKQFSVAAAFVLAAASSVYGASTDERIAALEKELAALKADQLEMGKTIDTDRKSVV